jgi:type I restriction enzyme S subunit
MNKGDALSPSKGWQIKKLGEVCEISTGKWDANHATENGEYRFYTCAAEYLSCDTKRFSGECLILPGNGVNVGKVFYYNGEFDAYQRTYVISNIKVFSKYLHYHMLLFWADLGTKQQYGAATNFIKIGNFNDYEVQFPPLPEQHRIVSILNKCFSAIEQSRNNAEQNLKNAKELFESYLQGVFENRKDWEVRKLKDAFEIKPPKKEAKEKLLESDFVTFLPMEDLRIGEKEINPTQTRRLKEVAGSYTYFAENDVLLAKITPCFENGKIGMAKNLTNGIGFGSSEYIVFRSNGDVEPDFLFYFLSRESFREEGRKYMSGAVGHKRVSKDWIKNYAISFPKSKTEQQSIVHQLDTLREKTETLVAVYQKKIADLEELRKSILQKAFAGELEISLTN